MVSFGLSPYEHARRLGYTDCSAVTSMQIEGGEQLTLRAKNHDNRGATTSYLECELPLDMAEDTYDFLRVHDEVRRICGFETAHTNCHVASGAARGWIEPDTVQPGLIEGYKLEDDEVERVRLRDLGNLQPGEVYTFTSSIGRRYRWLHPAHSIMQLPSGGLHFSQLGWRGNPYIGGLRGALNYYTGEQRDFYRVVQKPRDIDSDRWYQRVINHPDRVDDDTLNESIAEFERLARIARGVITAPAQRKAFLV